MTDALQWGSLGVLAVVLAAVGAVIRHVLQVTIPDHLSRVDKRLDFEAQERASMHAANVHDGEETRKLLMEIRDGINYLCDRAGRHRRPPPGPQK